MPDILIRGMEMPKSCFDCIFENRFFGKIGCNNLPGMFANELHAIAYTTERNPFCPLVPLPEGHGDLIDRDNVLLDIDCTGTNKFGMLDEDIRAFLRRYKPIVPAEGGKADGN